MSQRPPHSDFEALAHSREEDLSVPLALVLDKALEDAEHDEDE